MTERFDEVELLRIQKLTAELETLRIHGQYKLDELQRCIDTAWARHGLIKGVDTVAPDGTFTRGKKDGE